MPSLARGEASTSGDPTLDLLVEVSGVPTDVATLGYRIFDISNPTKRATPVQVYPVTPGTFSPLDPINPPASGHRLGVGHYYAPYEVPLSAEVGDHLIEWQYQLVVAGPYASVSEEFYVKEGAAPNEVTYCSVSEIRSEGFVDTTTFPDERIEYLAKLATRYIDKMTGRWFTPRTFTEAVPMRLDGKGGQILFLKIPIIRLDALKIESQGVVGADLTEIDASAIRVYNRHLSGMVEPDDRENPKIAFLQIQNYGTQGGLSNFFPRQFPEGRQNVYLEGVFGYTDPDGSEFGETPWLIRQVACRLVARDLYLDAESCLKLNVKQKYRIVLDKEGSTTVRLQDIWLRGAFTGDPEIDNVLMSYRRGPTFGAA